MVHTATGGKRRWAKRSFPIILRLFAFGEPLGGHVVPTESASGGVSTKNHVDYKKEKRREWLGILNRKDDTGGVHVNYLHSKYQNLINYNDCTKFSLKIELDGYFAGFYKGQLVPVNIEVGKSNLRSENTGNTPPRTINTSPVARTDNFLSGNYVVMGIEISWSKGGFKQILYLSKRNWVVNRAGNLPKAYPFVLE